MAEGNARSVAAGVLSALERSDGSLRDLLDREIAAQRLDAREIPLAQEITYGVLRRRASLDYFLSLLAERPLKKLHPRVLTLLRIGLYQILYMSGIPDRAAVNEAVEAAKRTVRQSGAGMVNAVLRRASREKDRMTLDPDAEDDAIRAAALELPRWFLLELEEQLGQSEAAAFAQSCLTLPPVTVRVNRARISPEELTSRLIEAGYTVRPCASARDGLVIEGGERHPSKSPLFAEGLFTFQDEASILVGEAFPLERGDGVLDLCAAPGGKTTHLAERLLVLGAGAVEAWDIAPEKIAKIEQNIRRLRLSNVTARVNEILKSPPRRTYRRILLDAPCGNMGVIRRRPDVKWRRQKKDSERLGRLQGELLRAGFKALEKGGALIYSVCTIEPAESTAVIRAFLSSEREAKAVDPCPWRTEPYGPESLGRFFWPHRHGTDGFFVSRIEKLI